MTSSDADSTRRDRFRVPDMARAKAAGTPMVMITAYDHPTARIVDGAGVDMILVGDSAAMVVLGYPSTTAVDLDTMLTLTAAVTRGTERALVIGDMPFGTYEASDEQAVATAVRYVSEAGVGAVKLEGGGPMISRVRAITDAGIPVFGHLGLTPQSAEQLGGFKAQARDVDAAHRLLDDAAALESAGACAIVLEAIPAEVATEVRSRVSLPTIGIGAGPGVDGQVLVYHDLVGLTDGPRPRFVEQYADIAATAGDAVTRWSTDVRARVFPATRHTYAMRDGEAESFAASLLGERPDA